MFRETAILKFIVSLSLKHNLHETSERSTITQAMLSITRSNSDLRNSSYFRRIYETNNYKMKKKTEQKNPTLFFFCVDTRYITTHPEPEMPKLRARVTEAVERFSLLTVQLKNLNH